MYYLRIFIMAMRSILSNKLRSFLTMLGIIIGVSSVIILVTLIDASNKKQMEQMYYNGKNTIDISYWNSKVNLSEKLYDFCKTLPEYISSVSPNVTRYGYSIKYKAKSLTDLNSVYFGSSDFSACMNYTLESGRDLCYADVKNGVRAVVIGARIKNSLFGYENPIGKHVRINGIDFTVIGTYSARSNGEQWSFDDMILLPYTTMRTFEKSTVITSFIAKAKDAESTTIAVEKLNEFLTGIFGENGRFSVYTENEWIQQVTESQKMLSLIVAGIAGISLIVGGIGIMNIMLVSVSERTREIGIRTSIGAQRHDIILQFLIESAALSAMGGFLGIAIGAVCSAILSAAILKTVTLPSAQIVLIAAAFSAVIGVFFGFYPANKASKLQPIDALRSQG